MTREESLIQLKEFESYFQDRIEKETNVLFDKEQAKKDLEAIKMAIRALEQEPCGDAISRQAAIDLADELKDDLPDDDRLSDMVMSHNEGILAYQTQLSLLPSVQPKQRTGHWIYIGNSEVNGLKICKCSNCKKKTYGSHKFCPNCGQPKTQESEVEE